MKKICIVCGLSFSTARKNQVCCSPACKHEHKKQTSAKYIQDHPEKAKEYQKKQNEERKQQRAEIAAEKAKDTKPRVVSEREFKAMQTKVNDNDPEWIKQYAAADRLTRISMLAIALTDSRIELMTYGKLSTFWETDQYHKWEQQVFNVKRKEAKNVKAKNSSKSQNKSKGKNKPKTKTKS